MPLLAPATAALLIRHLRCYAAAGRSPLIRPGLLRRRGFTVGLATVMAGNLSVAEFFVIYPYWLQRTAGLTAFEAGVCFLPLSAGFLTAASLSDRFTARLGTRTIALGAALLSLGYLLLAAASSGSVSGARLAVQAAVLLVVGFGIGTLLTPRGYPP